MASKNFAANLNIGAKLGSSVGRVFSSLKTKIKDHESSLKTLRAAYKQAEKGSGEWAGKLDQLKAKIAATEKEMLRLRAAAKFDIGKSFSKIGSTFMGDAKRLAVGAGIMAGATVALGAAIYHTTKGFVDWIDDIGDTAEALGMSTQALQTWQFAASTVGVGAEKMSASLAKFSKTVMDGGDKTDEALGKLHINAARLRKLKLDDQIKVFAEAMSRYKGADKSALAMKMMGKSGWKLVGILSKGAKAYDEFKKAGIELGAVLDDDGVKAGNDAADSIDKFNMSMVGLRNTIAIQFVPVLQTLVDRFNVFVRTNGKQIKEWAAQFGQVILNQVVPALISFADKLPGIIDQVGQIAEKVWNSTKAVADFVGGWGNLGAILLAANFLPTVVAIGQLTVGLWGLAAATWAATGPIGLIAAGVIAIGAAIYDVTHDNRIGNWLMDLIPEKWVLAIGLTLQSVGEKVTQVFTGMVDTITGAFSKMFDWIGAKFDWFVGKAAELGAAVKDLFSWGAEVPQGTPRGALRGPPAGYKFPAKKSSLTTPESMPPANRSTSQINNVNIHVNAPGQDGACIARQVRQEIARRPLFDMDGALVPA